MTKRGISMGRMMFSTVAAAIVALGITTDRLAAAKPPADYTAASVTFRDWNGDRIKSDGLGQYVEGQKGSVCRIYTGGSQDLTIGTFQSHRTMWFFYTPATDVVQPTATPPRGTLQDNSFVNIHNIGAMLLGETKITHASFNTAIGYFRWLDGQYNSQAVMVTRNSRTNWTVSADLAPMALPGGGDLSVLLKDAPNNTFAAVGLYHMPFGLDVNCPNCQ
jgi:hypothetical protein